MKNIKNLINIIDDNVNELVGDGLVDEDNGIQITKLKEDSSSSSTSM